MLLPCRRLLISLNEVLGRIGTLANKDLCRSPIKEDSDEFITGEMVFSGLPEDDVHFVHILEEVKDCNDGTVKDSKAELECLGCQDER
jgi:hypothetical protein